MERINIGNQTNDGTGDSIREAFRKVNTNFTELYGINNLGDGLFFTKLKDTPRTLQPSSITTASIIVVDNFGNTLTNKKLVAGQGITIVNTDTVTISNPGASLSTDLFPTLGGNLNASNTFRAINFVDPQGDQDLATKFYVDNNSPYSRVNLYVSTNGRDTFPLNVPPDRYGRSLAYAFKTIYKACEYAESLITTSTVELSAYKQFIQFNNGAVTATVYDTIASPDISGATRVRLDRGVTSGSDQFLSRFIRPGQLIRGQDTETIGFIYSLGQSGSYEYYDVQILSGAGFRAETISLRGEYIEFAQTIPKLNITILVESGTYEEQLPIRVPENTSIRGDEFRRVIIKPKPGVSTSKWAKINFRRDASFDSFTKSSNDGKANLAANVNSKYGYHYLTDPLDITSSAKLNEDMDVFLLNDATILRALSVQGHGGFMCVLDPEGQIETKSPYIQNCSSFSKSNNEIWFGGGEYVDGFAGNLEVTATNIVTYYTGTLTLAVANLIYRQPQTPTAFYHLGNRYEVNYVTNYNSNSGNATLHLNPNNPGGVAFENGVITVFDTGIANFSKSFDGRVNVGGLGYNTAPYVLFSQPTTPGGYATKGTANLSAAGTVTSITITNPGSGYVAGSTVTVTFIGGNPIVPADPISITGTYIKTGFIGTLPYRFELLTAGNKSILNADFTQVNDQAYGIVVTNNALSENVSVFTYYNNAAFYANNGGILRSANGSNAYGDRALVSQGSDPNELAIPVLLMNDMVQTATVVSAIFPDINTVNTTTSAFLYIRDYRYLPNNQSEIEVDHGTTTDLVGNILGVQRYSIVSANTVSSVTIPNLAILNFSTGAGLGLTAGGLKAPVSSGTVITIRGLNQFDVLGVNNRSFLRTASSVVFDNNTSTDYAVIGYDGSAFTDSRVTIQLQSSYKYLELQTYPGQVNAANATSIKIVDLTTATFKELEYYSETSGPGYLQWGTLTQYTFAWRGGVHRITNYTSSATLSTPWASIDITPGLVSQLTNFANTLTFTIKAGLRQYSTGKITNRLSILRATGHDLVDIGTGGYAATRYPNDLFGPPDNKPNPEKEVIQLDKGRVFSVTQDQDGNFKVGRALKVNQSTGELTINASLQLSNVSGLGFQRGVPVAEFSGDDRMAKFGADVVPTQVAVVGYVARRLGLGEGNSPVTNKIGSGYLDLGGVQSMAGSIKMAGNTIDMQSAKILNITTSTSAGEFANAANKWYVDAYSGQKLALAGISAVDPITGSATPSFGKMTGKLVLSGDPENATDEAMTAVTLRYTDRIRTFSTLSDVSLVSPADVDILMFNNVTVSVNTQTVKPVYHASRQITNVRLWTPLPNNTVSSSGGGSDVSVTRNANTFTIKIVGGLGANNPITNYHINDSAAIEQSKLNMNAATTRANATGITQADRGLASFNSLYFSATNGWINLNNTSSFLVNAVSASKVSGTLTRGTYLTGSNFDGSANTTWAVDATSVNTGDKVVARDSSGNFSAGTITANLSGNASCATKVVASVGAGSTVNLLEGTMATNDAARITIGGAANDGYLEIATLDDGTEPILVRQYTGASVARTAYLLDCSGNTSFPGTVTSCYKGTAYGTAGTAYNFAFQIREADLNLNNNLSDSYRPRLAFHWGNVQAGSLSMRTDGGFSFEDQNGTSQANVHANCVIASGCFVGVATSARYADLAEKYHADYCYAPCTVLQFGGKCEVTVAQDATTRVAGVVSTKPAYLMNDGAVGQHLVSVALQGRVPCKVKGSVRKGDLMVSAGDGYAKACANPFVGSVIGKSLEDFDGEEGVIEIVVGRL